MGMAASQARFLGLTARKSNTEYEGQQVNQQRTALANQSANLFNSMLSLEVPTPPSATNYYSIRYTYTDDGCDYEIISQTPQTNGKYTVKTKYTYSAPVAVKNLIAGDYRRTLNEETGAYTYSFDGNTLTECVDEDLQKEIGASSPVFFKYTNENGDLYYIKLSTMDEVISKMQDDQYSGTTEQYNRTEGKKTAYKVITDAQFDSDSSGRLTRIHYTNPDTGVSVIRDLTMTQVDDTSGYDQAMNEYYYKKAIYDKTIADIDAKTKMIQQQDRTLELRLRQLDTEENALKTEMEAVKKVIENNVDSTFKTFA